MTNEPLLALWKDEAGFIVSAELVLIATIAVLSMLVGLSEVANAINQELEDVGSAFGALNQTYEYMGFSSCKADKDGSSFEDHVDCCDSEADIVGTAPTGESGNGWYW